MDKSEIASIILGFVFFFTLIAYVITHSRLVIFLHSFLLIVGLIISLLMINKVSKSSNSLKLKIYFSLIISSLIFFLIIFCWFFGDRSGIDDKGLTTSIIIIPSVLLFGIVSFIIGITLSIKRKEIKDFDYNIHSLLGIITLISVLLILVFFYNNGVYTFSKILKSESLCSLTLKTSYPSYMFSPYSEASCLSYMAILKNDEKICDRVCDSIINSDNCERNIKNSCYYHVTVNKKDIKICLDSPQPFDVSVRCGSAFLMLREEIYIILSDPSHSDIIYALKATPYLGVYYDDSVANRIIPLIKNIVVKGSLEAKKEALEILFKWSVKSSFLNEQKKVLREQVLPLIENQSGLEEYVDKINSRLNSIQLS